MPAGTPEVHHRRQALQRVAALAQFTVAVLKVEQSRLLRHTRPPSAVPSKESRRTDPAMIL